MTKYEVQIDYADNGALAKSKCQTCRDTKTHIFTNEVDGIMQQIESWHKNRMQEHDKKHTKKAKQ